MLFIKNKNDSFEYKSLNEYKDNIENLLSQDKYISKREYISFYDSNKNIYDKLSLMDKESVLYSWCKNQKTDYNQLKQLIHFYENTNMNINSHNEKFIDSHLQCDKKYLDEVLINDDPNIQLDIEQRRVVLSDEDYTLVIAGAGAGKTTTIEAKVKYLIDKQNIDPNKILIISFTRKATKELQDRCKKLNLPVKISTFHSIANAIISSNDEKKYRIVTGDTMFSSVKNFLLNNSNNETFVKTILLFFASYLQAPKDEDNISLLFNELNRNDFITLRSDIERIVEEYKTKQTESKRTIKNEKVRSIEECKIANYLFINGIDYEYEPIYKYGFNDTIKPYCPDFLIKQYDKEIYLEHFGISENGKNSRFSDEELLIYKQHVNDKIKLHKQHGTKLIYTFSKYNDKRDLISHLKEKLIKSGISFDSKNNIEIYNYIIKNMEDKYFNKFIQLICVFISRFKTNNFTASKFDEWKVSISDERTKLFTNICYQCYLAYMSDLKKNNSIDFEDMINNASAVLDKMINSNKKLPYDYIFVDEYQDISLQRFDLCEKLSKCSNAKIIAVGDDWQSIFRFRGSKIELFTKFEELMGYANILKITKTYRNSQELIDIAGGFVMSNNAQIKKSLKSNKSIDDPVLLISYDDSYEKNNKGETSMLRMGRAIEKSLDMIVNQNGDNQKILFIGRYGFEGYLLEKFTNLFSYNNSILRSIKYPNLKITYLTAHSSKGLGYDNVIIINGKDTVLGFPSQIADDPVMKLVIKDNDTYDFAEERRLFYVALTRTKNRVYIITPKYKPSQFILEIKDKFENVVLDGEQLEPKERFSNIIKCPCCGYPLQRRINSNFKFATNIWICSNDPEICGFITNDLHGGKLSISKCPKCQDGYLLVKTIKQKNGKSLNMLGCSNYKVDGTGCSFYMMNHNYSQDIEEVNIKFFDARTDINAVSICRHPFKEVVNCIIEVVDLYKNLKIAIGPKLLFSILSGEKNKTIESFKFYNNKRFGYITFKDRRMFYLLLKSMQDANILKVDENNYGKIIVLKESLDENDYKIIYGGIKL